MKKNPQIKIIDLPLLRVGVFSLSLCAAGFFGALHSNAQDSVTVSTEVVTEEDAQDVDDWAAPFQEAIDLAQRRSVKIYGRGIGREKGYASGVIVSPKGYVITAIGVFLADDQITAVMADGREFELKLIRRDDQLQMALMQLVDLGVPVSTPDHFTLPKEAVVQPADWVLAVGNWFKVADGEEKVSVNLGIVSMRGELDVRHRRIDIPFEGEKIIVDAITSNPGAGGSALMTADGRLAGIVGKLFASKSTNTRLNYAVPAEVLHDLLEGKVEQKDTPKVVDGKPWTGVKIFRLGGRDNAAYIDRVVPGSPADKAGLKKDDQILAIGTEQIVTMRHFVKHAKKLKIGETQVWVIRRDRTNIQAIPVTPIAEPEDD